MKDLAAEIASKLEDYWADQSLTLDDSESIDDLVASMDSFTAADVLEEIETMVGMDLPAGAVIRRGGYDTKEQFVAELSARIVEYVTEHQK
jgi:hypothetical protein